MKDARNRSNWPAANINSFSCESEVVSRCNWPLSSLTRPEPVGDFLDATTTYKTGGHKSGNQKSAPRCRSAKCQFRHIEFFRSFAHDENTRGNSGRFYIANGRNYNSRFSGVVDVVGERGSKTSAISAATYATANRQPAYSVSSPLAVSPIQPSLIGNPCNWTETMRPPSPILAQGPVSQHWRQNGLERHSLIV